MQNNIFKLLLMIILSILSLNLFGKNIVYKCKNQDNKLVYQNTQCNRNSDTLDSWTPKEEAKTVESEGEGNKTKNENRDSVPVVLKLKQNRGGHYASEGSINDKALTFVIDTGASYVSLPESVAHEALIYCDDKINMSTANGNADACTTKIKKLKFGPFTIQDVHAVIVPNLGEPLMGMNVLQLFKISQDKGEMQISVLDQPTPK